MTVRLIVIDNECEVPKVLAAIADGSGFNTLVTNAPRPAIDLFLRSISDAAMIAMVVPEHHGVEVLREIAVSRRPTKVLQMSPSADAYLLLASQIASHHATSQIVVLHKPFQTLELSRLAARLSHALSGHDVVMPANRGLSDALATHMPCLDRACRNQSVRGVTPPLAAGCEAD